MKARPKQVEARQPVENDSREKRPLVCVPAPRRDLRRSVSPAWRALAGLSLVTMVLGLAPQAAWGGTPPTQPAPYVPGKLLVKLKPGVSASAVGQAAPGISAEVVAAPQLAELGVNVLQVPDSQLTVTLASLQQNPLVEYAEPDYLVHAADVITPNDPSWGSQWGPPDIQAPQAWAITTGTMSVTIAVIDTGVDLTHPDLAGQIWTNPGEMGIDARGRDKRSNGVDDDGDGFVDDWRGWNFVSANNNPQDDYGHGTHVAGIAAAIGNNGIGIAGMAWGVRIMPLKVLDSTGNGFESDVASAVDYAADHGARVINLSLGGYVPMQTLANAVNYAYGKGVTVVAAAGNGSTSQPFYPAANPHVIAVASVDSDNQLSYFSNTGPDIALAAPGGSIYSTMWPGSNPWCSGSQYCTLSGTSMATPHVAGVAALLASLPQFNSPNRILTAMESTALDLGSSGWDQDYGYGLVQAADALQVRFLQASLAPAFQFAPAGSIVTCPVTVTYGALISDSFTLAVSAGAPFTNTVSPDFIGNLAPNTSAPATVTVAIPPGTPPGTRDTAWLTVTSVGGPSLLAVAPLTVTVPYTLRLFPLFR